jgi:hypothetical protein
MLRRDFIRKVAGALTVSVVVPLTAWQDDFEARWDAFRERLRNRMREIAEDGHNVNPFAENPQ